MLITIIHNLSAAGKVTQQEVSELRKSLDPSTIWLLKNTTGVCFVSVLALRQKQV